MLSVALPHQKVQAFIFVAATAWVAFTKSEDFVDTIGGSELCSNHLASLRTNFALVGRIQQLAIPPVTSTLLRITAAIRTRTIRGPLHFLSVL